jgi:hypothetical protein
MGLLGGRRVQVGGDPVPGRGDTLGWIHVRVR